MKKVSKYPDYTLIGKRIKERRVARTLTQEKLAELADVSAKYISPIETGDKPIGLVALYRIAQVLDTTLDPLVFGD